MNPDELVDGLPHPATRVCRVDLNGPARTVGWPQDSAPETLGALSGHTWVRIYSDLTISILARRRRRSPGPARRRRGPGTAATGPRPRVRRDVGLGQHLRNGGPVATGHHRPEPGEDPRGVLCGGLVGRRPGRRDVGPNRCWLCPPAFVRPCTCLCPTLLSTMSLRPREPGHGEAALAHQQHPPVNWRRRSRPRGADAVGGPSYVEPNGSRAIAKVVPSSARPWSAPSRTARSTSPWRVATFSTQRTTRGAGTRTTGTRRTLPRPPPRCCGNGSPRRTVRSPWLCPACSLSSRCSESSARAATLRRCATAKATTRASARPRRRRRAWTGHRRSPCIGGGRRRPRTLGLLLPHRGRGRLEHAGGCADGPPPEHPPELHADDAATFAFPLDAWDFSADFHPAGDRAERCRREWSTPVR